MCLEVCPRSGFAMAAEASPPLGSPPSCLSFQRPGIYEDEKGRTWMTVVLRINPSHQVLSRNSRGSTVSPGTRGEAAEGRCMNSSP